VQWFGMVVAVAGLAVLVSPGLAAPPPVGAMLMTIAGASWGGYTWWGRGATNPLDDTATNFVRAIPFVLVVSVAWLSSMRIDASGAMLAVVSGAIASGLGYVAWYAALRHLSGLQAAVVQLSVPVLAAAGGVIFLAETISTRLVIAAVLVLGGIALAVSRRSVSPSHRRA
jgi:drug/metabolite transporter (DMT)-like permease